MKMSKYYRDRVKEAIEEFDYFSHYGKHGSLSGTAFFVLRTAFKKNDELFQKGCSFNLYLWFFF